MKQIFEPLTANWHHKTLLGIDVPWLIILGVLLIICYIAGILAATGAAKKVVSWIEDSVLGNIPGYKFMKKTGESLIGFDNGVSYKVVLADIEDSWQIGFLIEHIDETHLAVYVPGAPSPWSGSLYYMTNERIKELDITYKEAMNLIRNLGAGSGKSLSGKIPL